MRDEMVPARAGSQPLAFSLVEVVIALGVVSFALLAIIGVFGGILRTSDENIERQEIAESVDALRSYLNSTNFATAYDWASTGKELLYVTYKTDATGAPGQTAAQVASKWMPADADDVTDLDSARSGRWIRARLKVSASNPGGTNLPDVASYKRATLFVLAEMDSVETPAAPLQGAGRLQVTLSVHR